MRSEYCQADILITKFSFEGDALQVFLATGREMRMPLEWFPKLRDASPEARCHWRLVG